MGPILRAGNAIPFIFEAEIMTFTFYNSKLCPRCAQVKRHLKSLLGSAYTASCIDVDAVMRPIRTWQDGIRMIPALKYEQNILSGVLLSKEQIRKFLVSNGFLAQ